MDGKEKEMLVEIVVHFRVKVLSFESYFSLKFGQFLDFILIFLKFQIVGLKHS